MADHFDEPDIQMVPNADDSMFVTPNSMSDTTLIVDGKKLHVSKCVLGLASPVFLKMFEGDYKDKTEIPLADKKYDDVVELLLCIYPSTNKKITRVNLDVVLPLADEYRIESLKQRCEDFVLAQFQHQNDIYRNPANKELVHFLYLADKYNLKELIKACVEKVKFRTYEGKKGIKSLSEFTLMSSDTKFQVLSERMSGLEVPVRQILVTANKNPIDQRIDYTLKPKCNICINELPWAEHENSIKCRLKSAADLKALSKQVYALSVHFNSDSCTTY